jgi:hypothetical protein
VTPGGVGRSRSRAASLAVTGLIVLAAPLLLGGCGAGNEGDTSEAGTTSAGSAGASSGAAGGGSANRKPGGSHYEGAEEEVESIGTEAEAGAKEAILGAEQGYLSALAQGSYADACSFVSPRTLHSLESIATARLRSAGCATLLSKFLSPSAPGSARQQLSGEVRRVRIKGAQGLVIFHAPGARLWVLPLLREGDEWKVGNLLPTVLAPSAATLGQ